MFDFPARGGKLTAPQMRIAATSTRYERTMLYKATRIYANPPGLVRELPEKPLNTYIKRLHINTERNPV